MQENKQPGFKTTHWSNVIAAGGDDTRAADALSILCSHYWFPLYCFARSQGYTVEQSEDFLQSFFVHLLEKSVLQKAQQDRGKFRNFLLTSLKNFIVNYQIKQNSQKRGGGEIIVSIDLEDAENLYRHQPVDDLTPDKIFMKRWANTLIKRTLDKLQKHYDRKGKTDLYDAILPCITGEGSGVTQGKIAEEFDLSENAVKMSVRRLRQQFNTTLREEIAETVSDSAEVDQELMDLLSILAS